MYWKGKCTKCMVYIFSYFFKTVQDLFVAPETVGYGVTFGYFHFFNCISNNYNSFFVDLCWLIIISFCSFSCGLPVICAVRTILWCTETVGVRPHYCHVHYHDVTAYKILNRHYNALQHSAIIIILGFVFIGLRTLVLTIIWNVNTHNIIYGWHFNRCVVDQHEYIFYIPSRANVNTCKNQLASITICVNINK